MSRDGEPRGLVVVSALVGLLLQTLPLPALIAPARPAVLVLVVIWWSLMAPRAGGLTLAFLAGLALDVFKGAVLGQFALATALVGYIAIRQHLLVRYRPPLELMLFAALLLTLWEVVLWMVDGWAGSSMRGATRWLHLPVSAVCWFAVAGILGRLHRPL
jgi:rod shape-determining protein MreD